MTDLKLVLTSVLGTKSEFKHSISNLQKLKYPASWFRQQIEDPSIIFGAARKSKYFKNFVSSPKL